MSHELKIMQEYADEVYAGNKTFEVRKDDRNYRRGDRIVFRVVDSDKKEIPHPLTGKEYKITYILSGFHMDDGYVVLAIRPTGKKKKTHVMR